MPDSQNAPETFFASPERAGREKILAQLAAVSGSALIRTLVRAYGSMIAVLNANRQVLIANDGLLAALGVDDPEAVLGLRPGEAFGCVHAARGPSGCGTGRVCSDCGAAIAIVLAQDENAPAERECLMTVEKDRRFSIELNVRAVPLDEGGEKLVLLMLRNISEEKRRQALEKIFFHDIRNTLGGLKAAAEMLPTLAEREKGEYLDIIAALTGRIANEVETQEIISRIEAGTYTLRKKVVSLDEVHAHLETVFLRRSDIGRIGFELAAPPARTVFHTDFALYARVLVNMVKNAVEAAQPDGRVAARWEVTPEKVAFRVWNTGTIPENVQRRLFTRHFSTKGERGRGLGTFSMKIFGEQYLGGKIDYVTSEAEGTTFSFTVAR